VSSPGSSAAGAFLLTTVIPEPATGVAGAVALATLGGVGASRRRRACRNA
jgi:MYXO-CTERM domain-containing protein